MPDSRTIQELIRQIERGELTLPEFQRGYVWNRRQVSSLVTSLYRKHPTGHLLVWKTNDPTNLRGAAAGDDHQTSVLIDGQQRLTSLYVLFNDEAPPFYEGEKLHRGLWFNIVTETFNWYQKTKMKGQSDWIDVHKFLSGGGLNGLLERSEDKSDEKDLYVQNIDRLNRLDQIKNHSYTVDQLSGDEFSMEKVVEVFNMVNSAGTRLNRVDLAMAHLCTVWPEARREINKFKDEMRLHRFNVDFSVLGRCLAGVATGSVLFGKEYENATKEQFQNAWKKIKLALAHLVNVLRHEAFIDSTDDLPSANVLIPAVVYLANRNGVFPSPSIKKRFIRWIYLAGLWQRYSGQTESTLQRDTSLVTGNDDDPTPELEHGIVQDRGRIRLEAEDLEGKGATTAWSKFSYIVARSKGASDWFSGIRLYDDAVGKANGLESHHIFPKAVLQNNGFDTSKDLKVINEFANRAFLTQKANRTISAQAPSIYLPEVEETQPGCLQQQCIPMDRSLWASDRYLDFLQARRELLAQEMNRYIDSFVTEAEKESTDEWTIRERITAGESRFLEFKASLRWDYREGKVNKVLENVVIKTLAGFLNAKDGGTLLIGISDDATILGIEQDYSTLRKGQGRDEFELHLNQLIARSLGESVPVFITPTFHSIDGHDICQITVESSDHPIYDNEGQFYLRVGNATRPLPVNEAVEYIQRN